MARSFRQVAICGTGLIGTSLALALRRSREAPRVLGFDLNAGSRRGAAAARSASGQKAFDDVSGNLGRAVAGSDLIVVATPVRAMELLFRELAGLAEAGTVISDTGSAKRQVLEWAEALLPEQLHFVGGHPMIDRVEAGPESAEATLFDQATYCLCPLPRTPREAVDQLVDLAEALGATPYFVDAHEHDGLVAAVSQLPYLASVGLMTAVAEGRGWREAASLATSGFATATHLTQSDPQTLSDAVLSNREPIVWQLDRLIEQLTALRSAIAAGDEAVKQRFERAQEQHRAWLSGRASDGGQSSPPIDTSGLRPQTFFFGNRLGNLLRGRRQDREE